jgi:alpha-L-fucosidase
MMSSLYELKKNYVPLKVPVLQEDDMQWFRDSKFGMFIHFGLYSMLGRGEWVMFKERTSTSEYAKLGEKFTLEGFDAKAWARAAKEAGMKYMVLTTRHHDGFSLFDSKVSSFNSVNSAAKRDIVAEYVEACRAEGLKVGLYYSPMDWRFPGYFFPEMYFESAMAMKEQCWGQLSELMTNYGKIDMLWFDGEWLAHGGIKHGSEGWYQDENYGQDELYFKVNYFWESEKLITMIRALQPGIIINNRGGWQGDFHVREKRIGNIRTDKPWEACDCIANSWGYIPNQTILSLRELIKNFISIVTKDGNYLLNVGPDGQGVMETRQIDRLSQLGEWLEEYGEAIYGTRGGPFLPGEWGGATYKDNKIYIHITEWIEDTIVLPNLNNKIRNYRSMNSKEVTVIQKEHCIEISVPLNERDKFDTIVVLEVEENVSWEGVKTVENDIYGLADGLQ